MRKAAVEAVTSMLHDEEDALAMEGFLGHFRVRIVETGSDREPSVCLAAHKLLHLLLQHGLVSLQQLLPVMRCAPGRMHAGLSPVPSRRVLTALCCSVWQRSGACDVWPFISAGPLCMALLDRSF